LDMLKKAYEAVQVLMKFILMCKCLYKLFVSHNFIVTTALLRLHDLMFIYLNMVSVCDRQTDIQTHQV